MRVADNGFDVQVRIYFVAVQGVKMRSCKMAEGRELSPLVYIILLYKGKHDAMLSVTVSVARTLASRYL